MKIEYFGHSCFLMRSEGGVRFLTDPYTGVGYDMPRAEAEYVTCSHGHFDHTFVEGVGGVREVISSPGAYERGGWKLEGIPAFHDEVRGARRGKNIVFVFEADGLRLCHMGDIGEAPSARLLDAIGRPDVLFIPVGGTYTVDAAGALDWIRAVRPGIAVAMHFRAPGCTLDIAPARSLEDAGAQCLKVPYGIDLSRMDEYAGKILIPERKDR